MIYDFDELTEQYLKVDPRERISNSKLADALDNIAYYLDERSKTNSISQKANDSSQKLIEDKGNLEKNTKLNE